MELVVSAKATVLVLMVQLETDLNQLVSVLVLAQILMLIPTVIKLADRLHVLLLMIHQESFM